MTKKSNKSTGKMTPESTQKLGRIVALAGKIASIVHWVGVAGMLILAIFGFSQGSWLQQLINFGETSELNVYGFETTVVENGLINYNALGIFALGGAIIMALMALVFRNVNLISENSLKSTPFQADNVRMLRELGVFFLAVPVVGVIFGGIIVGLTGAETATTSMYGIILGLVMLYLTQLFAHGVELEEQTEGLI